MFSRLFFVVIIVLITMSGCAAPSANEAVEPSPSPAAITASAETTTPEVIPEIISDLQMSPSGVLDSYVPNPYEDYPGVADEWRFRMFEVFRDAEPVSFDGALTYMQEYSSLINDEYHTDFPHNYICEITLPQSTGGEPWAKQINAYYEGLLPVYIAEGDDIWSEYIDDWYVQKLGYYYENAYRMENVITVVRSRNFSAWRPSLGWYPIAENFSALDGQKLSLDDLFSVSRDEYMPVIEASLLTAPMRYSKGYDPLCDDGYRPMADFRIDNFNRATVAVALDGLVFIYPAGAADSNASGVVILCVPYEDLQGILSPIYFPTFTSVKKG